MKPYSDLDPRTIIGHVVVWQVIGLVLLAFHVLLTGQTALFYPLLLIIVIWLHCYAPLAAITIYFQIMIYQNWVLSVLSPTVEPASFTALQGTSFTILVVMAAISLYRLMTPLWLRQAPVHDILWTALIAMGLATAYAGLGAVAAGFKPAMIYYREITSLLLSLLIGLDVGRSWGYKTVATCFLLSTVLSLGLAVAEIIDPLKYYAAINATHFMNMKFGTTPTAMFPSGYRLYSPQDLVDYNTQPFFNITAYQGDLKSVRFDGTLMHIIAYGYVLSIIALVSVSLRRSSWLIVVIPLMIFIGVKGALMLFVCTIVMWFIWLATKNPRLLLVGGIVVTVAYVGYGIYSGLQDDDFHVIGFLGGVKGFMHNPFGHGLGVGGNLSTDVQVGKVQWTGSHGLQQQGADFALESAVGVMIYQMGLASFAVFAVFYMLMKASPFVRGYPVRREHFVYIAAVVVAINGVFQEEAYSPNAAGMLTLLGGVLATNGSRDVVLVLTPIRLVAARAAVPLMALALVLLAQPAHADVPEKRLATLASGVNITTVFTDDYRPLQSLDDLRADIERVAAAHFTHIRIMVNPLWVNRWDDNLQRLDAAVDTALRQRLGVILCLNAPHRGQLVASDDDAIVPQWLAAWQRLAGRYAPRSTDLIFFELANEPRVRLHWPALQEQLRAAVRQVASDNTLILTGSPNSTPQALAGLPISTDTNVVYSFHLYKPMIFTHQSAEWAEPRYGKVQGLIYPPSERLDTASDDPLLQLELTGYKLWGSNIVRSEVALVAAWMHKYQVHVMVTEFGVFRRGAPADSRTAWLSEVHQRTRDAGMGSTVWEYRGGFGIQPELDQGCDNPLAREFLTCQ